MVLSPKSYTQLVQTYRGPWPKARRQAGGERMRDRRPQILFGHHDDSFNYPREGGREAELLFFLRPAGGYHYLAITISPSGCGASAIQGADSIG